MRLERPKLGRGVPSTAQFGSRSAQGFRVRVRAGRRVHSPVGAACPGPTMPDRLAQPPPLTRDHAVFLDLDGTLAGFESTPGGVGPQPRRTAILKRLVASMDGAVAIVSGRTLAEIDHILERAVGPAAGGSRAGAAHGRRPVAELRAQPLTCRERRSGSRPLVEGDDGLLLEDKGHSVALHYRRTQAQAQVVRAAARRLAAETGLVLQEGDMVCELRSPGADKGSSLEAFLQEPPFAGRRPVAVGDDLTDEHAFEAAARLGGYGLLVGAPRESAARYGLKDVEAVLAWLEDAGKRAST